MSVLRGVLALIQPVARLQLDAKVAQFKVLQIHLEIRVVLETTIHDVEPLVDTEDNFNTDINPILRKLFFLLFVS